MDGRIPVGDSSLATTTLFTRALRVRREKEKDPGRSNGQKEMTAASECPARGLATDATEPSERAQRTEYWKKDESSRATDERHRILCASAGSLLEEWSV